MLKGKHTHATLLATLLLGALGGTDLSAQEGYSFALKLRAGLTAGDIQKTHFDNKIMAFAVEGRKEMPNWGGALFTEVTWEFVPGRHHEVYPWNTNPIPPIGGETNYWGENKLDPRFTYDDRKEYGQGFGLRFGYAAPMPTFGPSLVQEITEKTEWFAGIGLDMHQVRTEVRYTINLTPVTPNPPAGMYDGGAFTVQNSTLTPGVFVGLKYHIRNEVAFEMSLRNFGMAHYKYTPAAYYTSDPTRFGVPFGPREVANPNSAATYSTGTSRGWAFEFALSARI